MTKGIMNNRNKQILTGLTFGVISMLWFASSLSNLVKHFISLTPVPITVLVEIGFGITFGIMAYRLIAVMKDKVSKRWFGRKNLKLLGVYFILSTINRFFEIHISVNADGFYKVLFLLVPIYLSILCFKEAKKTKKKLKKTKENTDNKPNNTRSENTADS